jgi:hypothetical protein
MEGHELLSKVNRVKAPPDFEDRVLARLGEERRARIRRQAVLRYSFAGTAAVLIVGFVLIYHPFFRSAHRPGLSIAAGPASKGETAVRPVSYPLKARDQGARTATYLPVLETVDYSSEFRRASYEPRTVYILEQVSEVRPSEIKY